MVRRCLFAVGIMVLLALGSTAVAPPQAKACCLTRSWTKTYYSSATYSTTVGEQSRLCDGRVVMLWGSTSAYYTQEWFEC